MVPFSRYPLSPDQWRETPLEAELPDNDDGYDEVQLHTSSSPVVLAQVNDCLVRPVYEGLVDIHGNPDASMKLEGGLKDGTVWGVETVVRGIEAANRTLKRISDGEFQLVVIEVLRTRHRQRAGHRKVFGQMLTQSGIISPAYGDVWMLGKKAGRIFSIVRPTRDEKYNALCQRLRGNSSMIGDLRRAANQGAEGVGALIEEYVDIAASLGSVDTDVDVAGLTLPGSHIVHGGGAFDVFIANKNGRVISVVPYDYPNAKLASYRFLENDANYEVLLAEIRSSPLLAAHYRSMGFSTPEEFRKSDWILLQQANRMLIRLVVAMGGTTYCDEGWHFEFGTQVFGFDGQPIIASSLATVFSFCGGTGYTVIRQGLDGLPAVWHTAVTEAACVRQGLLV